MPLNSVIYCRTACSPSHGIDLAAQEQEKICRAFADAQGHDVFEVFADLGISGLSKNRDGFYAMLTFLRQQQKPFIVFVSSHDRLARDLETLYEMDQELAALGATVVVIHKMNGKEP